MKELGIASVFVHPMQETQVGQKVFDAIVDLLPSIVQRSESGDETVKALLKACGGNVTNIDKVF